MTAPSRTAYQETIRGLLRLHRYTVEGQDQTDAYHELCAALEGLWGQMTPLEQERTGGLSQDLYTVSDPPRSHIEPMPQPADAELSEVYEACERRDWDTSLKSLREFDAIAPPALLASLRGSIWAGLGEMQVASVFHERAHQLGSEAVPT